MARDNPLKKRIDGKLISLKQLHEVVYWTAALKVDVATLRRAVKAVGHSAAKVRAWLKDNGAAGVAAKK